MTEIIKRDTALSNEKVKNMVSAAGSMAIHYLCFAVYSKFEPTFDGLESDQSKPSYLMDESHSNDFFASMILPNLG